MDKTRSRYKAAAAAAIIGLVIAAGVVLLSDRSIVGEEPPRIDTAATMQPHAGADGGTAAAMVNESAPEFRLPTLDGDTLSMADLMGQVVVINFWATWCAPCRVEIPDLIEMQDAMADKGVRFVGIALEADAVDAVRAFADEADFNYPIVLDDGDVADDFGGIYALPTTILIDREGVIVRHIPGLVTRSFLMPLLEDLAAEGS